jgi:hypothetical protein
MASSMCSVKPIQPLDTSDRLLGDDSTEVPLQNGEAEVDQEEEGPLEDAEGEDDDEESVGSAFLGFHVTTHACLLAFFTGH